MREVRLCSLLGHDVGTPDEGLPCIDRIMNRCWNGGDEKM